MNNVQIEKNKKLRKVILEILYDERGEFCCKTDKLQKYIADTGLDVSDQELHREIEFLKGKLLVKVKGEFMGSKYLNFVGVQITSDGCELVEDPQEFAKLFSININNQGIMAMGGGGGGGGGGFGGGRGGDGGAVNIGISPDQITLDHVKNVHSQYWKGLRKKFFSWFINHILVVILVSVLASVLAAGIAFWLKWN